MQQRKNKEKGYPLKQERTTLRQTMRLRETVALGVGGTIGGAIFILVGRAINQAGPLGALLSFVLAFLASVVIALPYAELACRYPLAGGGYAFVQAVLGRYSGFVMGWVYAGSWFFIGGYASRGFGQYLQQLFFGKEPRILSGTFPIIGALSLIVGIVLVNLAGGRFFARVQKGIVLLAVVTMIGYGVASLYSAVIGLHDADISRFSLSLPHGISGILEVTPFAFLALAGFDMVATAGEEVEKPKRTLPLAILLTLGIVLLLYLLVTAATAAVLPPSALGSLSPLSDAADQLFGRPGQQLIAFAAVLTIAATVNAVLVATSRITFAMARDGLLPPFLAHVHPSANVPRVAVLTNGAILALIALSTLSGPDAVLLLGKVGNFLYVLQFVFPLAALVVLRRRSKMVPSFHTPAPYLVLPLAFGGCLLLLYASGQGGIEIGLGWLTGGLLIFAGAQGLMIYLRRKHFLKKGYAATMEEIVTLKERISRVLDEPHAALEQLGAMQAHIAELKQLRAVQARLEELEQLRAAQARIEEFKQLRTTQARVEELELLRTTQARVEELELLRTTQARVEELKFLQTIQVRPTKEEGTTVLEDSLHETLGELHPSQEPPQGVDSQSSFEKEATLKRAITRFSHKR
jgi:basic amino acid/polyamine antiporter, APA family